MKKKTIISSGNEHHVSLSHDQRVAARSHLGKRSSSEPLDRIFSGDYRQGPGDQDFALLSPSELAARIKALMDMTQSLQGQLQSIRQTPVQSATAEETVTDAANREERAKKLSLENEALQSELNALRAQVQSNANAKKAKAALKKGNHLSILSLSDAEIGTVDLEKRMKNIRQVTQSLRTKLDILIKSSEQKR